MDFKKTFVVNDTVEELNFIGWGTHDITHFIITGLDDPLFMEKIPGKDQWQFVGYPDAAGRALQPVFSRIIEQNVESLQY